MGALSLEICREHAGWSVHCFNASFRLENVSPGLAVAEKLRRHETYGGDERPASTANINRGTEPR